MAAETETMDNETPETREKTSAGSAAVLKWFGISLAALLLLAVLLVFALDTGPGRRFVAQQVNGLEFENGLDIEIGEIEGSIYGEMVLKDLTLADPEGVFLTIPTARVDWHPAAYAGGLIDLDTLNVPVATLSRLPVFAETPTEPDAPLIPNINLEIDRLDIGRLNVGDAVTGKPHALTLSGNVLIDHGQATIDAAAKALEEDGLAGGDTLDLSLIVDPAQDELQVALTLDAPADGLVAGLTGVERPLTARIAQSVGTWSDWHGELQIDSAGTAIARVALSAEAGTYRAKGPLNLSSMLEGAAARMAGDRLDVDLSVITGGEITGIDMALRSPVFTLDTAGGLRTETSRFDDIRISAQLLTPGAIAEGLTGRAVRAEAVLDGAVSAPAIEYTITAGALGMGDIMIEKLSASGTGTSDGQRMTVPLKATAARVSGLPDTVGGLMTNLTASGTFLIADGRAMSDNLKLSSDRIDVTALVIADFASGTYTGGIQGQLNSYEVAGVGLVDVTADIKLVPGADGAIGLRGPVDIRTRRIDNEYVREFLGGPARVTADFTARGDGIYGIENIRLSAKGARGTGRGRYTPDGRIALDMKGTSRAYGPFSAKVRGTASEPVIRARVKNPTIGIPFSNVDAVIRGTAKGYVIDAEGGTPYGPFTANLLLRPDAVTTIDVVKATLAGVTATGTLRQAPSGPYVGDLALSGGGVEGILALKAEGALQAAHVDARVRNFRTQGIPPVAIRRADIDTKILLTDAGLRFEGSAQLAGLTSGTFRLSRARAEFDRAGDGTGTMRIVAEGRAPTPYEVAVNARLRADGIRAAIRGELAGQAFSSAKPARIAIEPDGTYRLAPATIRFRQGDIKVAGSYGTGLKLQTRFEKFDLGILNAFSPKAGIGGRASGSIDWAQATASAFPEADMRLSLDDFTRSGAVAVSQPVDIEMAARLDAEGGRANAVMRERGRVVGRMKIALSPLSATVGPWTERLLGSPLSGGLRYNGPASALFSFAGLEGQALDGPLAIAADVSGQVSAPQLAGVVKANALIYENEIYGTRIADIAVDGRFTNTDFILNSLTGKAGSGTVSASGRVSLSEDEGYPVDLRVTMANAQLAEANSISARVSGNLDIANGPNQRALISGTLTIPEARYRITQQGGVEIADLDGVRRKPAKLRDPDDVAGDEIAPPSDWALDIDIRANDRIFVSGMGLESEWRMALNVGGRLSDYRVSGNLEVIRGTVGFANSNFELERGVIDFTGEPEINPRLDIRAETDVDSVTAIININGRAYDPRISFSSRPARPEDEILSLILFGGPPSELGALEAVQLAASLNSLRGSGGGLNPLAELQGATGFDRLRIKGADEATGRGTALAVGEYLADDIYLEVVTDTRGFTATQIEIALSKALSILSSVSTFSGQSVNLRYSKDY
ncbi:translocation/assembly module TamB domain-containing protein [Pacificimonas sp. WHA3]|uniref:Translocation/assembly module TamB domain-containing protein n=1 Tax=Pacificimonas pallii TaxID=2827236 RepID=A0ABS6SBC9_9SPHN|nr:translocation/assembly module TamB domain-containing protein [Pacificimonas pallii]MBV7255393.1 translocation/assembly module TamB domain-containing protein [Pacificimonas pallii]